MALLEIRDLQRSYRAPSGEQHLVLDIPRFDVEAGEHVALEGHSGSGKTTLLNVIAGILPADSGAVRVDGHDLAQLSEARRDRFRAEHIGYVFQTFNLLQGYTALENVWLGSFFGKGGNREFAHELLVRLGLDGHLHHRPRQLSIGQQQRVALARALVNRPDLVLADEPTGNLDHRRAHDALTLIREICREQEAALLLVSHDPTVLAEFERCEQLDAINRCSGAKEGEGA
ncbi:MAG: ABC transporter ATP-binding protein [Planctomycetes bacterium]|nr:ABC transporter ATP-binding protein [Planctomycetota bacterium]